MKLIYRIILRISLALTVVLGMWATFFYIIIINEINDETDDSLEDYSEMIIIRALAGEPLPTKNNGSNNQYYLTQVSNSFAESHEHISYEDSMIYMAEKGEQEPARILSTIFKDEFGRFRQLVVSTPTIEKADLKRAILYWIIFLYAALLIMITLICVRVFYRSMKPLYLLLNWLDAYRTGEKNQPLINKTSITEFSKLNEAAVRNAERNEYLFEQQKQFISNASHEIQTPLAISLNRLEMLMEDELISPKQLEELAKTHQTLEYITKLNKSLLLLSKIDNNQYHNKKELELNSLIKRYLDDYQDVYAYRAIEVKIEENGVFKFTMNESLAIILMTNLLRNAYIHNREGGHITIQISNNRLVFRNSGVAQPLDEKHIFERFYQGNKKEGSTGLGLAIVRAVCKVENIGLYYYFEREEHCFELSSK